jgi:septal ring factor EnvC (AmiA/AmiB activator)
MENNPSIIQGNSSMKNSLTLSGAGVALCLFALAGCASKPTTADLMRQHATEAQSQVALKNQAAKNWEKGSKLVVEGEKRVKDGEKRVKAAERDLKKGQDDIDRGKREISDGQKLINESERTFRESFPELDIKLGE